MKAFGKARLKLLDVFVRGRHHRDRRLVADPIDVDHHGRLSVEESPAVVVLEAVPDGGDIPNMNPRAIRLAQQDDIPELVPAVAPLGSSKEDLPGIGLHAAARELDRSEANPCRNFVEGKMIFAQLRLRHFDADLQGANTG